MAATGDLKARVPENSCRMPLHVGSSLRVIFTLAACPLIEGLLLDDDMSATRVPPSFTICCLQLKNDPTDAIRLPDVDQMFEQDFDQMFTRCPESRGETTHA